VPRIDNVGYNRPSRRFPWNAPSQILTKATVEPAAYRAELAIAHLCTVELDEGGDK